MWNFIKSIDWSAVIKSRTIWVNVLGLIALGIQIGTGQHLFGLEIQGSILVLLNLILRFDTENPLRVK